MVALDQCVRSDCVVTLTIRPAPRGLGAPPSPRSAFPCFFFFAGGDFFKIEWAETGRGLFVLYNTIVLKNNSRYTKTVDMSNSAKKLGDNIRRIRLAKDMTQGDLCRKLGLDRAYMSNVESGKKNPTLSTITNIAKALDVSVDELLK